MGRRFSILGVLLLVLAALGAPAQLCDAQHMFTGGVVEATIPCVCCEGTTEATCTACRAATNTSCEARMHGHTCSCRQ
jgi:hypothetical protein